MPENPVEICFVLVEPAVPENIGAAARALNTMGFSQLRLVNPSDHLSEKAKMLAHGSTDILLQAGIYNDLEHALEDIDFSIATTAKKRSARQDYYYPEDARTIMVSKGSTIRKAALVFGREESGLTNQETRLCDIASTIPLKNPYPSINLGQAVMLYAYVFSMVERPGTSEDKTLSDRAFKDLKEQVASTLRYMDIDRNENLFNRILERLSAADAADSRLLLSVVSRLIPLLEKNR